MRTKLKKAIQLIAIIVIGILVVATVVGFAHKSADRVSANGAIPPPEGYPKLSLSTKVVTPTLAKTGETVLEYDIIILNTGAYTADQVTLTDTIPLSTTYNNDAKSSSLPNPTFAGGKLSWHGKVGFDASVVINFSVTVSPNYEGGILSNTATINDPQLKEPVTVMAETRVTDSPLFEISKTAKPVLPGKNKPLTYELTVTNVGQPAAGTQIVITDFVPTDTTFVKAGQEGFLDGDVVTWEPDITLGYGKTTTFTFTVMVDDVLSGTVLTNDKYSVVGPEQIGVGEPYITTVVDPILYLSKSVFPDPPGGNSVVTYTLTAVNLGSLATDVVITETVPTSVTLGNVYDGGVKTTIGGKEVIRWEIGDLDTHQSKQVRFTVEIPDIAGVVLLNDKYVVCSAEKVCANGIPVPSLIIGPIFEVTASLDPKVAHKPGGGTAEVTPTFTILNQGPGDAIDATALMYFGRISVSEEDMLAKSSSGTPVAKPVSGGTCDIWFKCVSYTWTGNIAVGEMITLTTNGGQSTIGGEEWTPYTATVVVTDELSGFVTEPITATAIGHVTHMAHLIPTKSAPAQIGPGQTMTYNIEVFNSGLSTDVPPPPLLIETLPVSVTLVPGSISNGGTSKVIGGNTVITWTLPSMSPGQVENRSFKVTTSEDLVSGTLIVNDDYHTLWYQNNKPFSIEGEPVTTTIHEVGLIDSYKTVTPQWAPPGVEIPLTWTVHVVNSGPDDLTGVHVSDVFPWQHSTYQRDAIASAGSLISDIVSLEWTGNVGAHSEQLITFTTLVDDFFEGELVNTATITHSSLKQPVEVSAVAYITNKPVLSIMKVATPDPVTGGGTLIYEIKVTNIGQDATLLTITDTVPGNTTYVGYSASSGGQFTDNLVRWSFPLLKPGDTLELSFMVVVNYGNEVVNDLYAVRSSEGASAYGPPVVTRVVHPINKIFLPIVLK